MGLIDVCCWNKIAVICKLAIVFAKQNGTASRYYEGILVRLEDMSHSC